MNSIQMGAAARRRAVQDPPEMGATASDQTPDPAQQDDKKGGIWNRVRGIFKKKK
jgi:hypothetical protein